jgi:hydroxyacylglutathione hydrolase
MYILPANPSIRVHCISTGGSTAYLIESVAGLVLVDAGVPGYVNKILTMMRKIGRSDLKLIFITHAHFDHYGNAAALRRITDAPIAIHHADFEAMAQGQTLLGTVRSWGIFGKWLLPSANGLLPVEKTTADIVVHDGYRFDEFGVSAVVLHTPGHTPGSCCVLLEGKWLFASDAIVSLFGRVYPQCYFAHDWTQVTASVQRLVRCQPEIVFPGHRQIVSGEKFRQLAQIGAGCPGDRSANQSFAQT